MSVCGVYVVYGECVYMYVCVCVLVDVCECVYSVW